MNSMYYPLRSATVRPWFFNPVLFPNHSVRPLFKISEQSNQLDRRMVKPAMITRIGYFKFKFLEGRSLKNQGVTVLLVLFLDSTFCTTEIWCSIYPHTIYCLVDDPDSPWAGKHLELERADIRISEEAVQCTMTVICNFTNPFKVDVHIDDSTARHLELPWLSK